MFFYISFLRPPPLQTPTFGNILITPQIANDLRTEPFDGSQDIFYSWSQSSGISSSQHETVTRPIKLTTWRQSNAYKEIPVPAPPGVRDGQSWRLILSTQVQDPSTILLDHSSVGRLAFPVMSTPVLFGARGLRGGGKQERIERVYRLRASTPEDPGLSLKITEQTSFDLDKKIWDSGIGLSSWLVELAAGATPGLEGIRDTLFATDPRNILELGAGTGIVALTLAAIRSSKRLSSENGNDRIITTDLESAIPLLEANILANSDLFTNSCPEASVLDWDDNTLPENISSFMEGLDAIVMADVTYNTDSFPALVRTISMLMKVGSKPSAILLGYKERDAAERTMWDLATKVGIKFEKIGERKGAGGAPVEIWLG